MTLGGQSRIQIEFDDDTLEVFYLFDLVNPSSAPVTPARELVFELPAGARGDDAGSAAGDNRQLQPSALQELETESVLDVEGLEFMAVIRIVQAAVGHNAVDIEGDQPDACGAGPGIHQITLAVNRSCMLSAPSRRPSASATSSALIR